jgi:hypothetical protein
LWDAAEPFFGGSFFGGSAHAPRTRRAEGDGVEGADALPPPLANTSATDTLVVSRGAMAKNCAR